MDRIIVKKIVPQYNDGYCIEQYLRNTCEAKFMKNLSNTEAESKESLAYKKKCVRSFQAVPFRPAAVFV